MLKTLLPIGSTTWENGGVLARSYASSFMRMAKSWDMRRLQNDTSRAPLNGTLAYLVRKLRLGISCKSRYIWNRITGISRFSWYSWLVCKSKSFAF
jgi:hypothetical protein